MPRPPHSRRERTAGTTLIEMIAYIAVLGVMISLCLSIFVTTSRLSLIGTGTLERMTGVEEIRKGFSETVREAVGVRAEAASYRTGPEVLVLELPCDHGARYAVFSRPGPDQRLSKLVFTEREGEFSPEHFVTYQQNLRTLQFAYDAANMAQTRRVSLRLEIDKGVEPKIPSPGHTFYAAIRAVDAGGPAP